MSAVSSPHPVVQQQNRRRTPSSSTPCADNVHRPSRRMKHLLATSLPSRVASMLRLQNPVVEPHPSGHAGGHAGGRSRYSKALPSVPVALSPASNNGSLPLPPLPPPPPPSEEKPQTQQPQLSAQTIGEADGKKNLGSTGSLLRKPVGSLTRKNPIARGPLSTSSSRGSSTVASTASSTASVKISRRPVGGVTTLHPPAQHAVIAPPEPSPTDSIGSLLSAYTREPDDSWSGSTYTAASTSNTIPYSRESSALPAAVGRGQESQPSSTCQTFQNLPTFQTPPTTTQFSVSRSPQGDRAPAPLPKGGDFDKRTPQPKPLPAAPSEVEQTTSPTAQIGTRRPRTANQNKELPDLKLSHSPGSTASFTSIQTAVIRASSDTVTRLSPGANRASPDAVIESTGPPEITSPSPPPTQNLPSPNSRLPGKTTLPDTPPSSTHSMGSALSKVTNLKRKLISSSKADLSSQSRRQSDKMRPPTPEYRKGDIDPPSTPSGKDAKPATPVSALGSPREDAKTTVPAQMALPQPIISSTVLSSALPPDSETRFAKPAPSFPLSSANSTNQSLKRRLPHAAPDLRVVTNPPNVSRIASPPSHPDDATSPPARRPTLPPYGQRSRAPSISPASSSNLASSSGHDGLGIVTTSPSIRRPGIASPGPDPRIVYSDTQEALYRGRDGTLYSEMKVLENPDPKAFYFPAVSGGTAGEGTIIAAKPLSRSHYMCYQRHRTMLRRSNRHYSLTCQTCGRGDAEDRWGCTFCYLRVCEACWRGLNGRGRVLEGFVEELREGKGKGKGGEEAVEGGDGGLMR
ncbi:hypothetical protein E4U19_004411 [Claviceps sp. Clav32 group G5]|nr:hypothetical protein E4U19_004411 [Claviceps sp. Clav32 group G5]